MSDVDFALRRQTEAAKHLLVSLRDAGADNDEELVADAIEGETSLTEAITAALAEADECDVLIAGLKAKEDEFEARRHRVKNRRERLIALIEQAMISTDQKTLKLPTATLTIAVRPAGIVVSNEAGIPARFWATPEPPAPALDRRAIAVALKAGESVPGACLDNGGVSLTVRRK